MRTSSPHRPARRRPLAVLALAALTAAVGLVVAPHSNALAQVNPGAYYQLVAVHSGKAITIDGGSTQTGAMAVQWAAGNATHQQFEFVPSGDGYYRLVARHSGMALDVFAWNPDNGAEIRQWTDLNGTNQQWQVTEVTSGVVTLVNRFSGKALDVWERSTNDGARVSQFDPNGGTNQQFRLVPVGGGNPGQCGGGSYHAQVTQSGNTYTATNGGTVVYSGGNYGDAARAAVNSLTPGRSSQQRVVVHASGSIGASVINLPSHTSFEVCGTLNAGNSSGNGAIQAIGAHNVAVPFLRMTGSPYFGLRFADVHGLHLGQLNLSLSGGLGIRFERDLPGSTNVRIDDVFVSGTDNHGVETWNVDRLTIGSVTARNTGFAGLLLNNTINAQIGRVDGVGAGTGTGYAAFRMANRAGRVGNSYPTNIRVGEVIARGGGRGIFCVSESGGLVIDRIDLAQTGSNAILIENCYNVTLAAQSGSVAGPGDVRIAARTEFANTADVTIENLTVTNSAINENPCGINLTFRNNTMVNSPLNIC